MHLNAYMRLKLNFILDTGRNISIYFNALHPALITMVDLALRTFGFPHPRAPLLPPLPNRMHHLSIYITWAMSMLKHSTTQVIPAWDLKLHPKALSLWVLCLPRHCCAAFPGAIHARSCGLSWVNSGMRSLEFAPQAWLIDNNQSFRTHFSTASKTMVCPGLQEWVLH